MEALPELCDPGNVWALRVAQLHEQSRDFWSTEPRDSGVTPAGSSCTGEVQENPVGMLSQLCWNREAKLMGADVAPVGCWNPGQVNVSRWPQGQWPGGSGSVVWGRGRGRTPGNVPAAQTGSGGLGRVEEAEGRRRECLL